MIQQQMAQKILARIDKPEAAPTNFDSVGFDMDSWATGEEVSIEPDEELSCGTTMCVAGWAAHLDGWRVSTQQDLATRGMECASIAAAGKLALDLCDTSIFYTVESLALACLRRMAAGEEYTTAMHDEENTRYFEAEGAF